MVGKFRLKKGTLGVSKATRLATQIPEGAIIEVVAAPPDGDRMVDIVWDGQPMFIFITDLRDRGERIDPPSINKKSQ